MSYPAAMNVNSINQSGVIPGFIGEAIYGYEKPPIAGGLGEVGTIYW
jgi:hypothetical protein